MKTLLRVLINVAFLLAILFVALATRYWVGWPDWIRSYAPWAIVAVGLGAWYGPGRRIRAWRYGLVAAIAVFIVAYTVKEPVPQTWIPLHEKSATVVQTGSKVTISNFRDAKHHIGQPAEPRWITETFDLDDLQSADLIMQPFGDMKALSHVMLSFQFRDDKNIAVSVEARKTNMLPFDALAGFFKHDQLYLVVGSERDVFGKRLARDPRLVMRFFRIQGSVDAKREYLGKVFDLANRLATRPRFYATISESCLTTLINLNPDIVASVPWYDFRRWIPGYAVSLFQELGIVDPDTPTEQLEQRNQLPDDVRLPGPADTMRSWSRYLHQVIEEKRNQIARL